MSKVAIMITSCDAYSDCWKPMIYAMDKCWPDRTYPRYIITNYKDDKTLPDTTVITIGDDKRSWCTLAQKGLEAIGADYIIFFQEDYWLDHKVNNDAIMAHIDYMEKNSVDYLKLCKDILRDEKRIGCSDYCDNPLDIRYSFNTAMAIWRVESVKQLLPDGWSGWEFERQIIPYVKERNIKVNSQCLYSQVVEEKGLTDIKEGAIVRGVWSESGAAFLKENEMEEILQLREIQGPLTRWLYKNCPSNRSLLRLPFWGALKVLKDLNLNW